MTKSIILPPHLLYLLHGMKRFKWNADKRRRALIGIEKVLMAEKPNWVLVYGDTITPKEWYNKSVRLC